MLRVLEAVVARRVLVNYRVDLAIARRLVPAPLEPLEHRGSALAGISLVRLVELRPRGLGPLVGLTIENLAHRIAVTAPGGRRKPRNLGTYVFRRDTESRLVAAIGSPLFAGANRRASFEVEEDLARLRIAVTTADGGGDTRIGIEWGASFAATCAFSSLGEVQEFFGACELGYSGGVRSPVRLRPTAWALEPVRVLETRSRFFEDAATFPEGTAELDAVVGMRSQAPEWVEVRALPEILEEPRLPQPA
jgi:hypothetical protein